MIVKLLTEHHLEFLSLKGGCRGLSESTHVKMQHCGKSHSLAYIYQSFLTSQNFVQLSGFFKRKQSKHWHKSSAHDRFFKYSGMSKMNQHGSNVKALKPAYHSLFCGNYDNFHIKLQYAKPIFLLVCCNKPIHFKIMHFMS